MNKMKRIFSLVLALVMVLGAFGNVVPAFAETVDAEVTTEELTKVPADVIGTEYEAAVRRLVAFGLVEGYPDGTYQPEKEINRAQFAKLLVYALGLDDAVRAAEGQSTGFKDVKAGYWADGYINVASGQGLIKGYPDGTFRPAAKVTYAHALTMLVRALGYQDEFLQGDWPGNYVAKAADVGITRGLRLPARSTEGSKRGIVAQLINNTLDSKVVEIKKYVGISGIEYEETKETLLKNKLDISKHEDTRIFADKFVDDGLRKDEVEVRFLEETRVKEEVRKEYTKGQKATFDTNFNVRPFIGEEVTTYLTDRDVVIYVESENDDRANFDYVEKVDGKEVSLVQFDKDYKFADDADVYVFNSTEAKYDDYKGESLKDENVKDMLGKYGKFVVKNNKVVYAEVIDSSEVDPFLVVLDNKDGVLEGARKTTEDYKLDLNKGKNYDDVFVFDTEGNELAVKDIKKGNLVYAQEQDYDGDDVAVVTVVQDNVVTGEVGTFRLDRVEVGGKTYKAIRYKDGSTNMYQTHYSVDGLEDIKEWNEDQIEEDMDDAYKEEVTIYLDATGKIGFLTTDIDSVSAYKYGVITRTYADGDRVRIYTTIDGKEGDNTIFKADKENDLANPRVLTLDGAELKETRDTSINIVGKAVKFKLNRDGEIEDGEFFVMDKNSLWKMNADFGKDTMRLVTKASADKPNKVTSSFSVNDNVTIIDAEGLKPYAPEFNGAAKGDIEVLSNNAVDIDDFAIAKWEDMKEDNKSDTLEFYVFPKKNRVNEVDGMVFVGEDGANTGSDEVAIYVTKVQGKADDIEVTYQEHGKAGLTTKVLYNSMSLSRANKVVKYKAHVAKHKSNGEIEILTKSLKETDGKLVGNTTDDFTIYRDVVVEEAGTNFKTKTKGNFVYRGEVVSYFEDKTKDARKENVVDLIVEDNVRVRVIGITNDKTTAGPTPGTETKTGVVTYINSPTAIKDGKLTLVTGFANQTLDINYKNDTKELANLKNVKIYIPGKVDMAAVNVEVNPGETKALGLDLVLKTADLAAGKYEVKLLIDGKLQDETLEVIVLDNVNTVKEIKVEGVKATGTYSVQLPLGVEAKNVTVKATDITLNSAKANVIDLTKVSDTSWTFDVEAEDGSKLGTQTITLVPTVVTGLNITQVDAKTLTFRVEATGSTPVKGLTAADFVVTWADGLGTTVDAEMAVDKIVESTFTDGEYRITFTKAFANDNKVTIKVKDTTVDKVHTFTGL